MVVSLTGFTPNGKITGSPSGTLTASALGQATDVVSVVQLPNAYTDVTTGRSVTVSYATGATAWSSTTGAAGPTVRGVIAVERMLQSALILKHWSHLHQALKPWLTPNQARMV